MQSPPHQVRDETPRDRLEQFVDGEETANG